MFESCVRVPAKDFPKSVGLVGRRGTRHLHHHDLVAAWLVLCDYLPTINTYLRNDLISTTVSFHETQTHRRQSVIAKKIEAVRGDDDPTRSVRGIGPIRERSARILTVNTLTYG